MPVKLGLEAKLYRNTGTYATPTWNEITHVKDVTLTLEAAEADATSRSNNGWRATLGTLKEASLEFEMIWDTDADDFTAIRNAFLNRTTIDMAVLDGPSTTTGSQGLRADWAITGFTRNEPLEEVITVSVTAKPAYSANPPTWMVVA